jgi:hypothetical protein
MGRASSTNGKEEERIEVIGGKARGRSHYQDQDVGGWIILEWILDT